MTTAAIAVVDDRVARTIQARADGHLAFVEHRLIKGAIMCTHSEVPEALGGCGLGSALIQAGRKAARQRELEVMPVCPSFAAWFSKHPEDRDLLHMSYRSAIAQ